MCVLFFSFIGRLFRLEISIVSLFGLGSSYKTKKKQLGWLCRCGGGQEKVDGTQSLLGVIQIVIIIIERTSKFFLPSNETGRQRISIDTQEEEEDEMSTRLCVAGIEEIV
jgi:hypothetical protein